ncbi:MAG: elongation factor 4 [Firmicutes bacterium ML8_F2]|nr:MAG: elongation factor 4 [Firmicutes bacterium ML8_F2]
MEVHLLKPEKIRNFCIVAHIDHGKSTLADRLLETTGTLTARQMKEQVLDQMDLERERGITIKLQAVRLQYRAADSEEYILNLIDTPGHVDFSYEVSRSLAACEGAILVVDAVQGIEAQTLANAYLALEHDLTIVAVINKIDLDSADPERVKKELVGLIGDEAGEAIPISAKYGTGVTEVLEAVVKKVPPPPAGDPVAPLKALVFDSHYDKYRGVIAYIRVMEGQIQKGNRIKFMNTGKVFEVTETGVFRPGMEPKEGLLTGEVGYFMASIKNVGDAPVGDTVTGADNPAARALPGYRRVLPMVFCGLFPRDGSDFELLREAIERLKLNDSALTYEPEKSAALGLGFRCGFLGLLHMDIVRERLEREYDLALIISAPSVIYRVHLKNGDLIEIDNPALMPATDERESIEEPYVEADILIPAEYIGAVMELCQEKRGEYRTTDYLESGRVRLSYYLPLAEIIYDYFDQLKSRTRGYASLDYIMHGFRVSNLVLMDILINEEKVDALSFIVHRGSAYQRGREMVEKLKEIIPRQMFDVPIQAAVDNKVIARETIKALRKNVTEKLYGGDVTRKRKLLDKQKEGKKKMKKIGRVEIPQEAFTAVLKIK